MVKERPALGVDRLGRVRTQQTSSYMYYLTGREVNTMQKEARTIYQAARLVTDLTQEQAAELIHVSVESVRAYERGATIPPSYIVGRMVEAYGTYWLAYQHLKTSDLGEYLPDISFRDLPTSVLLLQKEMSDTHAISGEMIEITCDGKVDKDEESRWKNVHKELRELIGAAFAVIFAPLKKEESPVRQHRRQVI